MWDNRLDLALHLAGGIDAAYCLAGRAVGLQLVTTKGGRP